MPFIPHTETEIQQMLQVLEIDDIETLFEEIPDSLRCGTGAREGMAWWSTGLTEPEITRLMRSRAAGEKDLCCFIGAGAYDHHIPAAVWELVGRGEFYSAYTPYQAEASQGTLQAIYEFQTMMAALTGMDVSNASLYEGASALGEAVLMAERLNPQQRVLMPMSVHPRYRRVVATLVAPQGIEIEELPLSVEGTLDLEALAVAMQKPFTALVIPQPNFFGLLEESELLTAQAHANKGLVIGLVNPVAMAWLAPPGEWGEQGADIACGEGQSLGIPLCSGGPYLGFLCCKQAYVRQMPGRIVGRTRDRQGNPGFVLTLQAREQHIRRSKATSNICTNQGLLAIAAAIHLSLLGPNGLRATARRCHANMSGLRRRLQEIPGVALPFKQPFFHETVMQLVNHSAEALLAAMAAAGIAGGYALQRDYPALGEAILVCTTEMRTAEDLGRYIETLARFLES